MRRRLGIGIVAPDRRPAARIREPRPRVKATTKPTYDKTTGKLTELDLRRNGNGRIDTWTDMDGAQPLAVADRPERGRHASIAGSTTTTQGKLVKVGFSRQDDGKPDAWAFSGPDGTVARVEISSTGDEKKIDRWEFYDRRSRAAIAASRRTPTATAGPTSGRPTRTAS